MAFRFVCVLANPYGHIRSNLGCKRKLPETLGYVGQSLKVFLNIFHFLLVSNVYVYVKVSCSNVNGENLKDYPLKLVACM